VVVSTFSAHCARPEITMAMRSRTVEHLVALINVKAESVLATPQVFLVIRKEVWVEPSQHGYAVFGEAGYVSAKEPRMLRYWNMENKSDRADFAFIEVSEDNGRTWGQRKQVPAARKEGNFTILGGGGAGVPYLDADSDVSILFCLEVVLEGDDILSGLKRRKIFYSISRDGGRTFGPNTQMIERGEGFDAFHFMKGVYWGLNSASIAGKPIKISRDQILLPLYAAPIDKFGRLYNPLGGYTFTYAAFMIGRGRDDFSSLEWESSQLVKIAPELSNRGISETAVAKLNDGRILAIGRGSDSHKWISISRDNGRTWSGFEPLRFDDGRELFSPSSYSVLHRHSSGRLYWIANIVPTRPKGNSPRYPLCLAEVDQRTLSVMRKGVIAFDTREEGEDEALQLSNFGVYEDRETHEIVVTYPRLFAKSKDDWNAPCMKYSISV